MKLKILLLFNLYLFSSLTLSAQQNNEAIARSTFEQMIGKWEIDKEASGFPGDNLTWEVKPLEYGIGIQSKITIEITPPGGEAMENIAIFKMAYDKMKEEVLILIYSDIAAVSGIGKISASGTIKMKTMQPDGESDSEIIIENDIIKSIGYNTSDSGEQKEEVTILKRVK
jgi:hypothetical protein